MNSKIREDRPPERVEYQGLGAKFAQRPAPPAITMSDVRLVAGEGKLTAHDVLAACNAVLRMRATGRRDNPRDVPDGTAETFHSKQEARF